MEMLIFVQVCRTIDKKLYVFNSSISSERTNEGSEDLKIVRDTQQFYKCQNSAEIVSHQVHLEFLNNCHILEILKS